MHSGSLVQKGSIRVSKEEFLAPPREVTNATPEMDEEERMF